MMDVAQVFAERGDLAHLALFLWASGSSALLGWSLRELAAANRRYNDFVTEIARLNQWFNEDAQRVRDTRQPVDTILERRP